MPTTAPTQPASSPASVKRAYSTSPDIRTAAPGLDEGRGDVELMAQVDLLDPKPAYGDATLRIQDSLAEPQATPVTRDSELSTYLFRSALTAVRGAHLQGSESAETISSILNEASNSTWLTSPNLEEWSLMLITASGLPATEVGFEITGEEIENLAAEHRATAAPAAALWFTVFHPGRNEADNALQALREADALDASVATAMGTARSSWPEGERLELLRTHLATPGIGASSAPELDAIGFHDADPETLAGLLSERFSASTNNTQRQTVVDLWTLARASPMRLRRAGLSTGSSSRCSG